MERSMVADIATAGSNLLVNGSFEATALGVGQAAGFQSIAGWTALTGGTIELWNAVIGVTATQGVNFAELDYLGGYDGFYQDVSTTAGQAYTLSFDLRSRPGYAISTQGVEGVWNDQVVATTMPGTAWGTFSVNVNGTGGQDRLTMREVQGQSGDGIGALLDNFRLVAGGTPNPQPAAQVSVAAAPALVTEGTNPSTTVSFSLNAVQASPVTVTYSTVNGTAVDGSDFTGATTATVVIPAGQTSVSVTIPILNDAISEPNETFSVVLNGATLSGQSIATGGPATVTILDNDPVPTDSNLLVNGSFEATALGVGQGAGFQSVAGWTALTGGTIELWNAVNGVTATQGVNFAELDYVGGYDGFYQDVTTTAGQAYTLSFDLRSRPGYAISTQGVEVVWNGQVVATTMPGTAWSTFSVNVNGTGGQDRLTIREVQGQSGDGIGALLDNFRLVAGSTPNKQPAAQVSVAAVPASVTEGTNPSTTVSFSLNAVQASPVTVTYSTVNGTAVDGSDFTGATRATVVIPAGQTSVSVTTPTLNDAISEPDETFSVVLNGATLSGQSIATGGPATVTILDNDPIPTDSNLLVNGSFEATAVGVGQAAGFQSVAGWTALAGGTIELWNAIDGVTATQGVNFAELDYLGGYDGFYQNVGTTAGQAYTLSFDLRSRPGYAISTQGVEVVWKGQVVATTMPGTAWSTFSVNVNGTGGQDRLTIREVQGQSGDGIGALLDNFRLVAGSTPNKQPAAQVSVAAVPALVTEGTNPSTTVSFSLNAVQASPVTVTYSTV